MWRIDFYHRANWNYTGHVFVKGDLYSIDIHKQYLFVGVYFEGEGCVLQWSLGGQKLDCDQKSRLVFDMCTDSTYSGFLAPQRHQYFN